MARLAHPAASLPRRLPLLLAPAGSLEAASECFRAGAGAVYVGLAGFSRGGSRNELGPVELQQSVSLAASCGKGLQLAINVIPRPAQRDALLDRLAELSASGLRAAIVNDIGLLREIRRRLPLLAVTASIGCGALNTSDVLFYEELGAAAVVLPGYIEPDEVAAIKSRTSLRVEIMLHMVDEFLQLGKCWMPSYLHFAAAGRDVPVERLAGSVKRGGVGSCYRICQQPWSLWMGRQELDRRLLPSRQLSRLAGLGAYLDAGADVIKIQGRSLAPPLAAAVVAQYRQAIDAWAAGSQVEFPPASLPAMWTVQGR